MTHLNIGKDPAPYEGPLARLGARQHQGKINKVDCILLGDGTRWAQTISRMVFDNDEDTATAHREVVEWCKTLPVAVVKELMIDAWAREAALSIKIRHDESVGLGRGVCCLASLQRRSTVLRACSFE